MDTHEPVHCESCGDCCKAFNTILPKTADAVEFIKARGFEVVQENLHHIEIVIPHRCAQLSDDNKCKIHDHKPKICREYPENAKSVRQFALSPVKTLPKGCAYRRGQSE